MPKISSLDFYKVATVVTALYFGVQIAPIAERARHYNGCVKQMKEAANWYEKYNFGEYNPESYCNGGVWQL